MSREYLFVLYSAVTGISLQYFERPSHTLGYGYSVLRAINNKSLVTTKRLIYCKIMN